MEKMIHQIIEKNIVAFLEPFKSVYSQQGFDFQTDSCLDSVEVTGYYKNEYDPTKLTPFVLLRLFILHDCSQIHISNIFLPKFMHHKAIGKHLIHNIFNLSKEENYDLFIVDMVDSFYFKMLNRGALPCNGCDDAVKIIDTTRLI